MPKTKDRYVRKADRAAAAPIEHVTADRLGQVLDVATRTIENHVQAGMPRRVAGNTVSYPLVACVAWAMARKVAAATAKLSIAEENTLSIKVRRELAELELAERRGQLVTVAYHSQRLDAYLLALRAKLLALPSKYAPELVGAETAAVAMDILGAARDEMLAVIRSTPAELDAAEDAASTASEA